jgi:hypothetical protein
MVSGRNDTELLENPNQANAQSKYLVNLQVHAALHLRGRNAQRSIQVIRIKRQQRGKVVRIESGIDQSKLRRLELHRISCVDEFL